MRHMKNRNDKLVFLQSGVVGRIRVRRVESAQLLWQYASASRNTQATMNAARLAAGPKVERLAVVM